MCTINIMQEFLEIDRQCIKTYELPCSIQTVQPIHFSDGLLLQQSGIQ